MPAAKKPNFTVEHLHCEVDGEAWLQITAIERVTGYVLGTAMANASDSGGSIARLYVDPATRRRGIGKALVQLAILHIREQSSGRRRPNVGIWVHCANTSGRAFWEAQGFRAMTEQELTGFEKVEGSIALTLTLTN